MTDVLVDGRASDHVPADDRGLLYGDHLFETIAFVHSRAPLWERHMNRLRRDAERLLIPAPEPGVLADECARLLGDRDHGVIRIALTRGSGGRAYQPPEVATPRRILTYRPWPASLASQRVDGIKVHVSPIRLGTSATLAGIKHGNRLEQVLAAEHARRAGVGEAVMFDDHERLIEAIAGNLVLIVDGRAITPDRGDGGVAGVGLDWLHSDLGDALEIRCLGADDLDRAEALMVINSVAGIRPVRMLDDRPLAVAEACRHWQQIWDEFFECDD